MASFLEIVELVNGDIVLQRADGEGEGEGDALMTIKFSDESKAYMPNGRLDVARAMIHAGIETASQMQLAKPDFEGDDSDGDFPSESDQNEAGQNKGARVLH